VVLAFALPFPTLIIVHSLLAFQPSGIRVAAVAYTVGQITNLPV
jgi:hypothetical protein